MSLLIDALKKAEDARQLRDESRPTAAGTPASTLQRGVFAAKPAPRRRVAWLALGCLGASALGTYLWWQAVSNDRRPPPAPPNIQAPLPTPAVAPVPTPAVAPVPAPAPAALSENTTTTPHATPPQPASTANTAPRAAASATPLAPRKRPPDAAPKIAASAPTAALRLSKGSARPPLETAYDELQAGRLDAAQLAYEQALRGDAKNTDALLGLASIAARRGQNELAQSYYLRALEADPNDATAQAGLSNARGQADPGLAESRLKSALSGHPESAALHFALGNLYARQSRWSEAQQAYFRAYTADPDNVDVVFNLAVSLDHLHQNKLAAQYYQQALDGPGAQRASFDAAQVRQRIVDLQP